MSSNTPLVSIIIPTFNRANLLPETLDSLLAQNYQNWECIVVDDGSMDSTDVLMENYIARDSRFQYHHRPKNRMPGGNAARNYGFELSKGDYIQWFDSDDIMLPHYLANRLFKFTNNVEIVICAGNIIDDTKRIIKTFNLPEKINLYKEYALWRFEMYTPSVLFKRSCLAENPFDENIKRGQETEFFTRIFFKIPDNKYLILNEALFSYRQHADTKTESGKKYVKKYRDNFFYILKSNFERGLILGDMELMTFYYRRLIKQFFKSVHNHHFKNSYEIIKFLVIALSNKNFLFKIELVILGVLYAVQGKRNLIRKRLLNYSIAK